ncbi:MAG: protein TolR [Rhodospirillaceae bacterium TMED167]|nr:protein TolR [Rhodospirillaceae bacterium]OUW24280.1 MAG: protein TolR [Rhodospirillaceae bacterium TMED167]
MGVSASQGSGRGDRRRTRNRPMSDINVTPFVDVMLVLLVIFMVTAPLLTAGVQVDLPKAQTSVITETDEPLSVTIDSVGRVFLQDTEIPLDNLSARLIAVTGANPDIRIFVRGDKTIDYGRVMQVMGTINSAGFGKVALITELPGIAAMPQKKRK